ncbi:MAG: sodium:solute symporter family protein [Gammaproteobacteria bacterium]|mgnify:CR=1 FL=1|nr:MAG: sodium:solute symporter family protein [Gammaproteobacteria bacterium]
MDKPNIMLLAIIIITYLLAIGYLGFLGFKKTKSSKDFMIAGGNINPFVMAMSYGATFISTSAIVGFGGVAGLFGMGLLWLTLCNVVFGIFIAFVFFGKRTRKLGHTLSAHTFPELLGKRFKSNFIQGASGLIIFSAMPLYAAVVLIGAARFLESTLDIDYNTALLVFSLVIAAYVVAGGLRGVMYTDALQGSIMFIGMIILLVITYSKLGGITAAHAKLSALADQVPDKLKGMGHIGWTAMPDLGSDWWWILVSTIVLGVGIGVLAQPQLAVRFMTVKSNRELNRAVLIGSIFIVVSTGVAFIVGSLSNVYFHETLGKIAVASVPKGNPDLIIPEYINSAMPKWFVYLFMIGLLSAGMSTLSSQFHAMGTSIGHDFIKKIFPNKDNTVFVTKVGIVIAIIISIILGYKLPFGIVARGTAIFFGICAATFLPVYIAALYWNGATKAGAIASIITGFGTSIFSLLFLHIKESSAIGLCNMLFDKPALITTKPWPFVDPILIALPLSAVSLIIVSMLTKNQGE